MKVDFKVVCIVMLGLCLVAENEAWWARRSSLSSRSSSRRSPSSSRSSSSRSSSSSSSSSRRGWSRRSSSSSSSSRRGWLVRRSSSSSSSSRRGWFLKGKTSKLGNARTNANSKTTPTTKSKTSKVDVAKGVVNLVRECRNELSIRRALPSWIISKIVGIPQCCKRIGVVVVSMLRGRNTAKTLPLAPATVFSKKVSYVTTVERPFNDKRKGYYGEKAINCLHRYHIETSISNNRDTITHSGILVTTEDNEKYLIQKMNEKIGNSHTRVNDGKDLLADGDWKPIENIKPRKRRTINDYYKESEPGKYNIFTSNCHDATNWMARLAKR